MQISYDAWLKPSRFSIEQAFERSRQKRERRALEVLYQRQFEESLVGILMTQRMMDSPDPPRVFLDFWTSAYQAIDD